jgi:hypothetical protein
MNHSMRRAALALHALDERDRDWMLHRLPVPQSETLNGLLRELRELGIPSDVLPGIADDKQAAKTVAEIRSEPEDWDGAAAGEWAAKEADWVVAQVWLSLSASKRADLLAALPVDRRQRLEKLGAEIKPLKGLSRTRLSANAQAAMRALRPQTTPSRVEISRRGVSRWLRSFVHRA